MISVHAITRLGGIQRIHDLPVKAVYHAVYHREPN